MNKKLLVSHIDLDGFGGLFLAKYFNDVLNFNYFMVADYGFADDPDNWAYLTSMEEIIFSDLSLSEEHTKMLREDHGIKVRFFDHHSKADWLANDEDSVFDLDRCGTKLFWEEYVKPRIGRYPVIIDEFVTLVDTYDLWKDTDPLWTQSKNLNSVMIGLRDWGCSDPIEASASFYALFERKIEKLKHWTETDQELRIIEKSNKREEDLFQKAKKNLMVRVDSKGKIFGVFALQAKISLVCARILKEEENLDYVVAFNTYGGLTGKLSFRSRGGFNCNDIGVSNGHDAAGGGQISVPDSFKFLETPTLAFTYNESYDEKIPATAFEEIR